MGSYYGALLARDGHDVTLVARGAHLDALRSRGAVVVREADGSAWEAPVRARDAPAPPPPDLAIVTTKSHHTLPAAHALAGALAPSTPVLSLQNGLENVARLASVLGARPGARGHRLRRAERGRARDRGARGRGPGRHGGPGRRHRARPPGLRAAGALLGGDPLGRHRPRPVAQAAVERRVQRDLRRDRGDGRRGARHPGLGGPGARRDGGGRRGGGPPRRHAHAGRRGRDGGPEPRAARLPPLHRPRPRRRQAAGARRAVRLPRPPGRRAGGPDAHQRRPGRPSRPPGGPRAGR